jgi:MoaA/NifB/PqqE/SkfB family radical SAM enzyme
MSDIFHQELLDEIAANPVPQKEVSLTAIRDKAKELRDYYLHKADLESQLKELGTKITNVERHDLIDMFDSAGISSVTVDADGNHPPFIAERTTIYGGKIPEERRIEALNWFAQTGHGDLVKSVITIQFGMQEWEEKMRVMAVLAEHHIEYYTNESVHHMTLKAFVKGELKAGHVIPWDLLGAYMFDEVKIK